MGVRRNLSPNPALRNNTTGNATDWTSSPSGYARQTGVTGMDRTTGFGGSGARDIVTSPRFSAVAGQQYVASIQVKTGGSNTFKLLINWYTGTTSSGTFISNSGTTQFTVNGTARCEVGPFTAPTGAGAGYLRVIEVDSTTATFTAELVEQTSSTGNTYFDGDTPGATWEGAAGNSTSLQLTGTDAWTGVDAGSVRTVAPGPTGFDAASFTATGSVTASGTVNEDVTWADAGLIVGYAYDARRGRNRLSAFGLPATGLRAVVEARRHGSNTWQQVRGGKVAVVAGAFERTVDDYEFTAGKPNTYRIRVLSTPQNVPEVTIATAQATLPAVNPGTWLKFIAQPALNQQVQLVDWSAITRPSRVALYDVQGRSDPVAVTDVHGSRRVTVTLRTSDTTEAERLDTALAQGRPLFLHVPDDVALPSLYAVAQDYASDRPSKLTAVRLWQIALAEVAAPPPSVVGAAVTWQSILDAYASWQDVLDAFPTWQDVVS